MRPNALMHWILALIVVLTSTLAACGTIATPDVAPPDTGTPTTEPTALPPQPPKLLKRTPEVGQEQGLDEPIVLRFDQPMDSATLQTAFRVEPEVEGSLTVEDDTLTFTPDAGFQRATEYVVQVDATAKSAEQLALPEPIAFTFATVGYLRVTDAFPMPDSAEVDPASSIRIAFNRPVVPLTSVDSQEDLPDPLAFSPAVAGEGAWINTSIYTFEPSEALVPGTTYTVTVPAGLEDTTGGVLEEDYVWSFTTASPDVSSITPADRSHGVSPFTDVRITFNQAMRQGEVQQRFTLTQEDGEDALEGEFTWEENTLVFTPTQELEMGTQYTVRMEEGAPSASGSAVMAQGYAWVFDVAEVPALVASRVSDGDEAVDPGAGLEFTFSSPISTETFLDGITITPPVMLYAYWQNDDTTVVVPTNLEPSTDYTVTLSTKILGRYGHPLAQAETIRFTTRPYDPMVQVNVPSNIATYDANRAPSIRISYRNVSQIGLALYSLPLDTFLALNTEKSWQYWDKLHGNEDTLIRSWSVPVRAPLNEIGNLTESLSEDEDPLPIGFYYLEISSPNTSYTERHVLVVTDMNLTLKSGPDSMLLWATDLEDATGVPDVRLQVYDGQGKPVAEAVTDEQGLATATYPEQDSWAPLTVVAQRGDSVTAVSRNWSSGIGPWEFGLSAAYGNEKYRSYMYTERQLYRPGQTVYFKGIVRADADGDYALPPSGESVTITVFDGQGREVMRTDAPLSEMGTIAGELALSEAATLGYYHIQGEYHAHYLNTDFQVAEYRKPEFEVQVTLDEDDYVQGDTIEALAQASYFFGGPVANATVRWRVMRSPYTFDRWQGKGYYSFIDQDIDDTGYYGGYGEFVTEGEGTTDKQGRFRISLPADISEQVLSQVYTIEAGVVDVNNQEVNAQDTCVVHKGAFYIGVAPAEYVGTSGKPAQVDLITVDTQGITRTNETLEISVARIEWYSTRELADDGNYYWTSRAEVTPILTDTVKTDRNGHATYTFTPPQGGTYRIRATGADADENVVRSATYLWVTDDDYVNWRQESNDRIALVANKKSYEPGDTARILVPSPFEGPVQALLTIERGHIFEHQLITLEGNSEQIEVPILPEYAPNVYVSITIVKGVDEDNPLPGFKVGYVMLPVSIAQQELDITITPDSSAAYKPGDEVTYEIRATDYRGRGVETELSLQLVDRAVEALSGSSYGDIVQQFYSERGLGIVTSSNLTVSVERYNQVIAAEGKGGGGGLGDAGSYVREDLPDTAYWAPAVQTDEDGRAKVTVTLPDNLTTWRMTAQGATAETQVGKATNDIVSTLDVLIRPVTPRFLVVGDQPVLGAVVHNNTSQALEIAVSLEAQGAQVENAQQTISVPAHDNVTVNWPAQVLADEAAASGTVGLRFSADAGRYADAIQVSLPVYHPSSAEVVGTSGEVSDQIIEVVRLPENADLSMGELSVQLDPSLAAGVREGLRYLEDYPYLCTEQTVSRFLPNVVTFRALRDLNVQDAKLEAKLPKLVGSSLQRLYAQQNLDGGWGWWQDDPSSAYLSAYVLLGLVEAERAGFAVDATTLERAGTYLVGWLDDSNLPDSAEIRDVRAVVLYALAEAGQGDLGRTVRLFAQRDDMSLYARAALAMTLQLLDPEETTRLDALVNEFADAAIMSATGTHWEEAREAKYAMNTDTRSTAIVLRALVRLQPESTLIPSAVRWLMAARASGRWETTQENVWAILALTDQMVASGELLAEYDYTAALNGVELASGSVGTSTVGESVRSITAVADLRSTGDNALVLERSEGPGTLYYSAFLRYYLPAEELQALNRGIVVDRQYQIADRPDADIATAQVNDVISVTLTVVAPNDLYYLVVEDPLPAGCEAIDTSLSTTSMLQEGGALRADEELQPEESYAWYWYRDWANHTELRDEKVALFADYLPMGTYEYVYAVRCTTPGQFKVMPTTAYEMYTPDVFGRSGGAAFTIANNP
ncbi:MAG: Ig-like domain-containing protein [Anaerolineae bacterium]